MLAGVPPPLQAHSRRYENSRVGLSRPRTASVDLARGILLLLLALPLLIGFALFGASEVFFSSSAIAGPVVWLAEAATVWLAWQRAARSAGAERRLWLGVSIALGA